MARRSLRPHLNQIRGWVRQGRTDAWIAHQLEVTVQQIAAFKRENELRPTARRRGRGRVDFDDEIDLRAEDDALIAAELEAARPPGAEEAAAPTEADEDAATRTRTRTTTRRPSRAGAGAAAAAAGAQGAASSSSRARSTTARRATGSGSTPPSRTTPSTPSTGRATARRGHDRGGPDRDPARRRGRRRRRRRLTRPPSRARSSSGAASCARAASSAIGAPLGEAFLTPSLPRAYVLNSCTSDAEVDADQLVAALDELYAASRHRRACVERATPASASRTGCARRGWLVERDVYMALRGAARPRRRPGPRPRGRRDRRPGGRGATDAREEPYGARRGRRAAARRDARGLRAAAPTRASSSAGRRRRRRGDRRCTPTARPRRSRTSRRCGRSAAAGSRARRSTAAIDAALDDGHELVFIVADDDDWPKDLYARLGFDPSAARGRSRGRARSTDGGEPAA